MSASAGLRSGPQAGASRKRGRDAGDEFGGVRRAIQAMETTFITIHDLTHDANVLYASVSISDVLDYKPEDVVGKSCWEFFHPDEVPFAKAIHGRGIELDKASVLNYCRIKNKHGEWVGCECVFTVVYNVLVGCTSIYMDGPKAKKRAMEAPVVRQLFSSSPRDPRYHMLQYISTKFASGPRPHIHEPRAALFLNRFTRTLTINFATNGLESLLGVPATVLMGQSFYYCIQPECLAEAIRCLESAKANDSIAYLRFWFRDPRLDGQGNHDDIIDDADESSSSSEDDEGGGVQLDSSSGPRAGDNVPEQALQSDSSAQSSVRGRSVDNQNLAPSHSAEESRHSSGNSTDLGRDANNTMFGQPSDEVPSTPRSMMSVDSPEVRTPPRPEAGRQADSAARGTDGGLSGNSASPAAPRGDIELEAVVSCTSDGLVVIMRAARPFVPDSVRVPPQRAISPYSNGLFASPWATTPIMPDMSRVPSYVPATSSPGVAPRIASMGTHPAFATTTNATPPLHHEPTAVSVNGPPLIDFMNSIRDVAVFAWALTGINGSLQQYGRGVPRYGSVPYSGLPVWDPDGSLALKEKEAKAAGVTEQGGVAEIKVQSGMDGERYHGAAQPTTDDQVGQSDGTRRDDSDKSALSIQQQAPTDAAIGTEKTPEVTEAEIGRKLETAD